MKTKTIKTKGGKKFRKPTEGQAAKDHAVVRGEKKKGQVISTRLPEVVVEYDFRKDGKIERRRKHFKDARKAKRFFIKKDKLDKEPVVLAPDKVVPPKQLKLKLSPKHGPQSLAEAFPLEPVDPNHKPTLQAQGDPTRTTFNKGEMPVIGRLVPEQQTEAELKAEARKAAKQLRRKQRKGEQLWKTKDTRTVVALKWYTPPGNAHPRWAAQFNDGGEDRLMHLAVVYSRDHADHHLRSAQENFIDGLNNKDYELLLKQAHEYAQRQANYYRGSLKNFRGSSSVQKEMEKRTSKKGVKGEEPLAPPQVELAHKLAELANHYACAVSYFFMLPAQIKKHPHATLTGDQVVELFEKHNINELDCTIRVVQLAKRLLGKMVARLEPGGPQIGTPELAAKHEKQKTATKQQTKTVTTAEGKVTTTVARGNRAMDAFGNAMKSGKAAINAEILAAKPGTLFTPKLVDQIDAKTIHTKSRTRRHFKKLVLRGYLVEAKGGYKVKGVQTAEASQPAIAAKAGKADGGTKKGNKSPPKGTAKPTQAKAGTAKPAKAKAKQGKAKKGRK